MCRHRAQAALEAKTAEAAAFEARLTLTMAALARAEAVGRDSLAALAARDAELSTAHAELVVRKVPYYIASHTTLHTNLHIIR